MVIPDIWLLNFLVRLINYFVALFLDSFISILKMYRKSCTVRLCCFTSYCEDWSRSTLYIVMRKAKLEVDNIPLRVSIQEQFLNYFYIVSLMTSLIAHERT